MCWAHKNERDGKTMNYAFEDDDDDDDHGCMRDVAMSFDDLDHFDADDDEWIWDVVMPCEEKEDSEKRSYDDMMEGEEEMVGGGLFSFDIREGVMPQRWRNVDHKTRHTARLQQTREIRDGDRLGGEMAEAVRRAVVSVVELYPNLRDNDRIHFTMQSTAFAMGSNHCFQSTQFRVSEIRPVEEASARFVSYMTQLARQLNSSQSFSPGDDFTLDVTTIRLPKEGGGRKKRDVIKARVRNVVKKSRIVIRNKDALCCAQAIVTMKAKCEEDAREFSESSFNSLRRGMPCQTRLALRLTEEAGVSPIHPCGIEELKKFQQVLSPQYQLKVLQIGRPHMVVFSGVEAPRLIRLLLEDGHYDGCSSFQAILNTSYFCNHCDRGFDHDTYERHPCQGRRCPSCFQIDCADFQHAGEGYEGRRFASPTIGCDLCHRRFFGIVA